MTFTAPAASSPATSSLDALTAMSDSPSPLKSAGAVVAAIAFGEPTPVAAGTTTEIGRAARAARAGRRMAFLLGGDREHMHGVPGESIPAHAWEPFAMV